MCCKAIEGGSALWNPFLGTVHITVSVTCIFRILSFHGIIRVTMCCRTLQWDSALWNPFLGTNYTTASSYNVYIPYNVCFYREYFTNSKIPKRNNVSRTGKNKVRIKHAYCNTVYWLLVSLIPWTPVPVAARSKVWVCSRWHAGNVDSNPTGGKDVCCECCVLSGRGLFVGLITNPEDSYRVWCVWVWSWILDNEEPMAHWGGAVAPW